MTDLTGITVTYEVCCWLSYVVHDWVPYTKVYTYAYTHIHVTVGANFLELFICKGNTTTVIMPPNLRGFSWNPAHLPILYRGKVRNSTIEWIGQGSSGFSITERNQVGGFLFSCWYKILGRKVKEDWGHSIEANWNEQKLLSCSLVLITPSSWGLAVC